MQKNKTLKFQPIISDELLDELHLDLVELLNTDEKHLKEIQASYHQKLPSKHTLTKIMQERLDIILRASDIEGDTFGERNTNYENALRISTKGYSVHLKRDVCELYINNYNPEWIKCWSGNMDIQIYLDFFAVLTYITDYYMKDESGSMKMIKSVLESFISDNMKAMMNAVKNT